MKAGLRVAGGAPPDITPLLPRGPLTRLKSLALRETSGAPLHAADPNSVPDSVAVITGVLSALLGLIVIVGWHLRNEQLIQVLPGLTPMAYRTAINFVGMGAALVTIGLGLRVLTEVTAGVFSLFGFTTLLQYASGGAIRLDNGVFPDSLLKIQGSPAPMAPSTALGLSLIAVAAILWGSGLEFNWRARGMAFCGSTCAALGLNAFIGYLADFQTYALLNVNPMAFHTGAGLSVLSVEVLAVSWRVRTGREQYRRLWFVILVAQAGVITAVSLWHALASMERIGNRVPELSQTALIAALVATALLAASVYWAQTAWMRAQAAASARTELATEVTRRASAEDEIRLFALRQAAIVDLGQLALRSEPSARVLDEAVHRLARTLAVDYAKVLELRTDGKSFLLRAGRGWKPGIVGNAIAPLESDSQAEFTLRSKQPVIMEDLQTETRFQDVMMFGEPIVASGMSVEISTSLGPYGVLAVHSRQRRKFSQDEVNFLQSVANILSTIVERTRAETILRESEAAFHTLADTVPQMVWMCMPDGLNIYFNQQWVDYTGLSLEESYGKGWNPPFHLDDKQKAWDAWNHATRTGEKYRVESRLRAADGSYRWFLMRGEPMRDAKANIVKWFGSCTDIEDMKHVEESLRRLNEQFQQADTYNRSLLEASLDPRVQQTSKNAAKRRAEVISPSGGPKRVDRVLQPSRGDRSPRGRASVS